MKNLSLVTLLLLITLSVVSCGSEQKESEKTEEIHESKEIKTEVKNEIVTDGYIIDPSTMKIAWTAFKTSEKVPVNGVFKDITKDHLTMPNPSKTMEMALDNIKFMLPISNFQSGDAARDIVLKTAFFGLMTNTTLLSGGLMINERNPAQGKMALTMGDDTHTFPLAISYEDNVATIKGVLDLNKWDISEALKSLHAACQIKHTGKDGQSKTWSEVEISGTVAIIKQ